MLHALLAAVAVTLATTVTPWALLVLPALALSAVVPHRAPRRRP